MCNVNMKHTWTTTRVTTLTSLKNDILVNISVKKSDFTLFEKIDDQN